MIFTIKTIHFTYQNHFVRLSSDTINIRVQMLNLSNTIQRKACFVFILAASFYLYEMVLQVAPSVMSDAIMRSLHIDAAGLGTISAFYFYAFAPMQIPSGLLYDRYGPRLLITLALLVCATGTWLFSVTLTVHTASLGRFLIGMGSAFSFIGVLLLIARWFPARHFALMAGITQLMSSLGAICGEFPLAQLALQTGWRQALFILALTGFILALLVWCYVKDYPSNATMPPRPAIGYKQELLRLKQVLMQTQTVWIGLYAFGIWAPIAVFGALWSVPFLCALYAVSKTTAAIGATMIWLGVGLGSASLGWLSEKINNRRIFLIMSAVIGVIASFLILYISVNWIVMMCLLLLFGFAAGGQTLSFAVVKQHNTPENMGTASGINNMAVLLGGAIFQPLVGYLLVANWDHTVINQVPIYSLRAYQKALFMLPLCYAIAGIVSIFFIKDASTKNITAE